MLEANLQMLIWYIQNPANHTHRSLHIQLYVHVLDKLLELSDWYTIFLSTGDINLNNLIWLDK